MSREQLVVVLILGFILLRVVWFLTDNRARKEQIRYYFSSAGLKIGVFTVLFLLLNIWSGLYFPLPNNGFNNIGLGFGLALYIAGLGLAIWAKLTMKKSWGVPAQHKKEVQSRLITTGPFKFTRNPIYLGFIMFLLGFGFLLQSYFTFLALIAIWYFYRSVEKEEKLLEKHFGKEYLRYKEEVPRFI